MEKLFNITVYLNKNGEGSVNKGTVEFIYDKNDYGNGYEMYIECPTEPFGAQGYDIRYDKTFDPDNMLLYIVQFFAERYDGENDWWKLTGIRVHEAEKDLL